MYLFFSQVIILNLLPPLLLPTGGEMSNLGSEIQKRKMPLLALLSLSLSLGPLSKPAFPRDARILASLLPRSQPGRGHNWD